MRFDSDSMRPIAVATASSLGRAPWRYSSEYPRILTSGVRSSCEASPTNRRIFASDFACALNELSICASIVFSEIARLPISLLGL